MYHYDFQCVKILIFQSDVDDSHTFRGKSQEKLWAGLAILAGCEEDGASPEAVDHLDADDFPVGEEGGADIAYIFVADENPACAVGQDFNGETETVGVWIFRVDGE